jgi:hypothetical protein
MGGCIVPDKPKKPRTNLPKGTPKELRDFVRCRSNSVDIKSGDLDWLPNMPTLTLSFEKGAKGSIVVRVVGLGGMIDMKIPVSIKDGRLVADTSNVTVPGDAADEWVNDFNADLQTNGMQLAGATLKDGKLHLTKKKIPAGAAGTSTGQETIPATDPPLPPGHSTGPTQQLGSGARAESDVPGEAGTSSSAPWLKVGLAVGGGLLAVVALAAWWAIGGDDSATDESASAVATPQSVPVSDTASSGVTDETTASANDGSATGEGSGGTTEGTPPGATDDDESVGSVPGVADFSESQFPALTAFAEMQGLEPPFLMIRSDAPGDFDECGPNGGPGSDVLGVVATQTGDTVTVAAWMAEPPPTSASQFSFAVVAEGVHQSGESHRMMYEVHDGQMRVGTEAPDGTIEPGSEAGVRINDMGVVFSFPADSVDPLVIVSVEGFHLLTEGDAVGCDGAIAAVVPFPTPSSDRSGDCTASATTACLNGGRFDVRVDGPAGDMFGVVASADDAAVFADDRSAGLIRVLNGCPTNGFFWVFADGFLLEDVSTWSSLTVTDTVTGEAMSYTNPLDPMSSSIEDTSAFAGCP